MELKDYLKELFLIYKISKLPLEEINTNAGYLRFLDIRFYEPCLLNYDVNPLNKQEKDLKQIWLDHKE